MARRRQEPVEAFTTERPDPLELIGRLLVGGGYRVPVEGKSTKSRMQTSDIAGAVGYMGNAFAQAAVVTVATRANMGGEGKRGEVSQSSRRMVARLSLLAYREISRAVRKHHARPLDLHVPADRWRLRIVIYDAACELVWPERRRPLKDLAKAAKMRASTYREVHKLASAVLQSALNDGRREFAAALWHEG